MPSTSGSRSGSRLRCSISTFDTSRSYARACSMASPARSAIRISRLSSSSVNGRGERIATSTTPASRPLTTSGEAISEPTPAATIIGSSPPPSDSS